jgi:hypothetical protein
MRLPCCHCVCMCFPLITARQRLGKYFPTATDTQTTIEELLVASFCKRSVLHQRKLAPISSQNFLSFT